MRFLSQLALPATAVQFTTAFAWENISRMVGWHHQLSGHESEKTLGDSEGQGILECFGYWLQSMASQIVGHD